MDIVIYLAIIFMGFFTQSTCGFGSALVAVPLLTFLFPLEQIAPMLLVFGFFQNLSISIKDRAHIQFKSIFKEFWIMAAGLPVGLLFLKIADENTAKIVLAVTIIGLGIFKMVQTISKIEPVKRKFNFITLFIGGCIQAAFSTGGPFMAMYYDGKGLSKTAFRVSMCSVSVVINGMLISQKFVSGLYTRELLTYISIGMIALIAGTLMGNKAHDKVSQYYFSLAVYSLMIFSGVSLIIFN